MHIIIVYVIAYTSTIGLVLGWRLSRYISAQARERVFSTFTKWVIYSLVMRRVNGSSDITVLTGTIILMLVAANIVGSSLLVRTRDELSLRLAKLSITNLVVLYFGGKSNVSLDNVLRLSHTEHQLLHRWVGRITVIEGLVHGILEFLQLRSQIHPVDLSLLIISGAIAATSIIYVRRRVYEVFLKTHLIFAVAFLVLLWLHIGILDTYMLTCISTAASVFALQRVTWMMQILYRNVGSGPTSRAIVSRTTGTELGGEILQVYVNTKRPWRVAPGQFVYLSLPHLRSLGISLLEAHPFMIAWVAENERGQAERILLLVRCYQGFTRRLKIASTPMSAFVDGPYGGLEASSLTNYDKILLMSNGIGIAAHLYTARHLLVAHDRKTARVRRLTMVWVLDAYDQIHAVEEFLFTLSDMDQRQILTVFCYYPHEAEFSSMRQEARPRIMSLTSTLDMSWFIESEWAAEAGNMLVAVCGSPQFELRARKAIRSSPHEIDFQNSDFQPSESRMSRHYQRAGF